MICQHIKVLFKQPIGIEGAPTIPEAALHITFIEDVNTGCLTQHVRQSGQIL
jgi:hypothetical protein